MLFSIIGTIVLIIGFFIIEISDCRTRPISFIGIGFILAIIFFSITFFFVRVSLDEVEWKTIENYEITYKPDFDNSNVFAEFDNNELKIFKKEDDSINELFNYKILKKNGIAFYKKYEKFKEGNFFIWSKKETKIEIIIPINILKEWSEKECKK